MRTCCVLVRLSHSHYEPKCTGTTVSPQFFCLQPRLPSRNRIHRHPRPHPENPSPSPSSLSGRTATLPQPADRKAATSIAATSPRDRSLPSSWLPTISPQRRSSATHCRETRTFSTSTPKLIQQTCPPRHLPPPSSRPCCNQS